MFLKKQIQIILVPYRLFKFNGFYKNIIFFLRQHTKVSLNLIRRQIIINKALTKYLKKSNIKFKSVFKNFINVLSRIK